MKKILHIPNYYPPHIGGIEQVCCMSVIALKNYNNRVICFNDCNKTLSEEIDGIIVDRIGIFGKLASQPLSLSYLFYLKKVIKRYNPDVIHFHVPNPLVSLYLLLLIPGRVKLIVHYHAEILTSKLIYTCYRPIEKLLFKRANIIIATSPNLKEEAGPLQRYKDKCIVVPNAIDTTQLEISENDKFRIKELRELYNNRKIVLSYGRHVPYKGLEYLIAAEPYIDPNVEIIIGGQGPLTDNLKRSTLSRRVHFIGRIPDDQLKIYLHAADVFAFPSITKAEAFGLTLAESMYCHTPTVSFVIPASGVNYVSINNETGFVVENSNPQSFADAINRLVIDNKIRKVMGEKGHNRVINNFSIDKYDENINLIYHKL